MGLGLFDSLIKAFSRSRGTVIGFDKNDKNIAIVDLPDVGEVQARIEDKSHSLEINSCVSVDVSEDGCGFVIPTLD